MATLIQSKQIEGVVTASVVQGDFKVSGSLVVTGSGIFTNDISATGQISASRVLGVRYDDISGTPNFVSGTGILITQVGDTITITNTGGSGGVSDAAAIAFLNAYTASNDLVINGINLTTASLQAQIDALVSATSSYITSDSDSQTLTIVGDQLTISGGNTVTIPTGSGGGTSDFTQLTNVPSGLISSSQQISDLGFIDTQHTDISALNTFTSSAESRLSALESATGSYLTSETDSQTLSIVGDQLSISSGNTITLPSGGSTDISALNAYTSSNDETITELQTRIDGLSAATSSYLTSETDSQTLSIVGDQLTISSGNTITIPTGSGGGVSSWNELTDIPSGIVSSSSQIVDDLDARYVSSTDFADYSFSTGNKLSGLDSFTSSIDSRVTALENATDLTGSDSQTLSIVGNQISISGGNSITIPTGSDLPSGLISSSQQISDLGYVTSSLEAPFNGNRVVSNTLLGDLYSQSFNAGTTGSLAEFISQVFFPSEAPTATFTNQTANLNTNLATNNTNLVSVELTDTVDNSPYTLTLSGTDASSLTAVPTNAESSSWEIRANGDLTAGTYSYNVVVGDSTDAERTYSGRSITIAQATSGTLSTNGTFYVIESATTGPIYLNSNGRSGTQGLVSVSYSPNYGSQVATNFSSSNPLISVNSTTGVLSVGSPISGSGNIYPNTVTSTISWEDQYGNTDSDSITLNIARNYAPTVTSILLSNQNTNQATGSAQIIRLTATDTEGDSIPNSGLVWTSYNTTYFSASVSSPYMYLYAKNISIPAGTYSVNYSTTDIHGFRTSYGSTNVTIQQATAGTLGGDINNYIIESAVSGDDFQDATGYGNGNQSQVVVSYSTNYGSQVPTFTSSNPAVVIDSDGYLNLGVDLSGSVTQSGDTFTSTITWEDQYGNSDSRTINVTVFGNQSPSVSFTDLGLNTDTAVSGSHIGTLTISDTEGNTPFSASIGGTDGGKFEIVPQNANSSSYYVYPTGSLTQGDYSVQFVVTDNYSETATLNETISVSAATDYGTIYVYTQNLGPSGAWSTAQYKGIYGISGESGDTPPEVTSFTTATSMLSTLVNNDVIGDSTITFASTYTMTLRDTISGDTTLDSALASNGNISFAGTANILLLYPSGSDMEVPTSIQETINGTAGGAVPYLNADGGGWGIAGAKLNSITLGTPHLGYSEWFVLGRLGTDGVGSSFEYRLINANGGSAPS